MYVVLFARGTQEHVDAQLRRLRECAHRERWTVVGEYVDILSGSRNDRRGFDRMLKDVQKGGIQAIVVTRRDRLGLSPRQLIRFADELDDHGAAIMSLAEGTDVGAPMRKCLYGFSDLLAKINDLTRWR